MTTPSEVAESMMAISSGDLTMPPAFSARPVSRATPNETAKPTLVIRRTRPRNRSKSTSSPAMSRRNASPIRFMTSTAPST
jgi:hypothetical protein